MTDIDKLASEMREAAGKATPGPWEWHTSCSWRRLYQVEPRKPARILEPYVCSDGHPDVAIDRDDMDYIALANPTNIVALLDERDRLLDAVKAAVLEMSNAARAQGEAEGRLSLKERECEGLREALERIRVLTPSAANAATARDLHLTVAAIAWAALTTSGGGNG